ncbi:MAG: ABC transporter substrate-binding protein [Xanthobacteraceae bacterium]|jgi:putative ABC transport system substrate-binding protein
MRRREFISLLGGIIAVWSVGGRAQQPAKTTIGFLGSESADLWTGRLQELHRGLGELGFVEGQNLSIEYRWAQGRNERLPSMASDLVRQQVKVIIAPGSTPAALAAQAATKTIPIVFEIASDPVELGLVSGLNKPGGNVTGVTTLNLEIGPKRLELLHNLIPSASVIGLLINPTNPRLAEQNIKSLQSAGRTFGLEMHVLQASTEDEFDAVFEELKKIKAGGLLIAADPFFSSHVKQLAALSIRHAVPTVYQFREFAIAGGLLSYGTSFTQSFRTVGNYTGRILKGERPADLPVQQATAVELIINQRTAEALGVTVPQALISRADEVIE